MIAALFEKSIHMASDVIEKLPDDLTGPTPCSDWNVRQLLNHMVYEISWVPDLLEGKTISEVGPRFDGDLLGADPIKAWVDAAAKALAAVNHTPEAVITHLAYGEIPAERFVGEVASSIIIHGWDMAMALGEPYEIDDDTAEKVFYAADHVIPMGRKYKFIGPQVGVPKDASKQAKLLGAYGRSETWHP
jgi:uncharacterized protein (TIGR03086 family)